MNNDEYDLEEYEFLTCSFDDASFLTFFDIFRFWWSLKVL